MESKSCASQEECGAVPLSLGTPVAFHLNSNGYQNHCNDVGAAQTKLDVVRVGRSGQSCEVPSQHEEII
jgi:hypothetical protein